MKRRYNIDWEWEGPQGFVAFAKPHAGRAKFQGAGRRRVPEEDVVAVEIEELARAQAGDE